MFHTIVRFPNFSILPEKCVNRDIFCQNLRMQDVILSCCNAMVAIEVMVLLMCGLIGNCKNQDHHPQWSPHYQVHCLSGLKVGLKHPIRHPNTLFPIHFSQSLADDFGTAGWSCWICLMVWWWWGLRGSVMAWMVWRHQESRPSCHPPPPGPYHPAYPTFSYPRPAEQTLF